MTREQIDIARPLVQNALQRPMSAERQKQFAVARVQAALKIPTEDAERVTMAAAQDLQDHPPGEAPIRRPATATPQGQAEADATVDNSQTRA